MSHVVVLMWPTTRPNAQAGCEPFLRHKSPQRPEVLKILFALLFSSTSEEECETQNGLSCCSSSTALQAIAINQFSWTDILVLLSYLVDSDACEYSLIHATVESDRRLSPAHAEHWRRVTLLNHWDAIKSRK